MIKVSKSKIFYLLSLLSFYLILRAPQTPARKQNPLSPPPPLGGPVTQSLRHFHQPKFHASETHIVTLMCQIHLIHMSFYSRYMCGYL